MFSENDQSRRTVLDGQPEPEPVGGRQPVEQTWRDIRQIEAEHAESTPVEEYIGGFERCAGIVAAANPEQVWQYNSAGVSGVGIEAVRGIDYGTDFTGGGSGGESRDQKRSFTGGSGAIDLGNGAAWQAGVCLVKRADAGGESDRVRLRPLEEGGSRSNSNRHPTFAFSSLLILASGEGEVKPDSSASLRVALGTATLIKESDSLCKKSFFCRLFCVTHRLFVCPSGLAVPA
jgi:hypothetical protein